MHGKGTYKWPDGGSYIGDYVDNLKEGFGKFIWADGKTYEGDFKGGMPHGYGVMITDGERYDVQFEEGSLKKKSKQEKTPRRATVASSSSTSMRKVSATPSTKQLGSYNMKKCK